MLWTTTYMLRTTTYLVKRPGLESRICNVRSQYMEIRHKSLAAIMYNSWRWSFLRPIIARWSCRRQFNIFYIECCVYWEPVFLPRLFKSCMIFACLSYMRWATQKVLIVQKDKNLIWHTINYNLFSISKKRTIGPFFTVDSDCFIFVDNKQNNKSTLDVVQDKHCK